MQSAPRLRRIDHCSEHGVWTLLRSRPPEDLAPHVREIQGYVEEAGAPVVRKEVPSGVIPLILVLGPGFDLRDPTGGSEPRALTRSFVAGLHRRPAFVGSEGRALCMQVDFTPLGARRFLRLDLCEIADQVVDLEEILGREASALEARLAEAADWPSRFELLESVLRRRILGAPSGDPRVLAAAAAIERAEGGLSLAGLAAQLGVSRKHLTALFHREIGAPPRAFARVLRFGRALDRLQAGAYGSLTSLAAECGYADQAHFNRDFRAFAGESPSSLLARTLADGTGLLADATRDVR